MRRVSRLLLAGAMVMVLGAHQVAAGQEPAQGGQAPAQEGAPPQGGQAPAPDSAQPQAQQPQKPPPFTFDGDVALWTVGVNPNHTADFEAVMTRLKDVLRNSEKPERRQQAAGWKIIRGPTNPQTGHVLYTHIINPVVRGADYNVLELIFEAVEEYEERTKIYEQYRAAFGATFTPSTGSIVVDMSR